MRIYKISPHIRRVVVSDAEKDNYIYVDCSKLSEYKPTEDEYDYVLELFKSKVPWYGPTIFGVSDGMGIGDICRKFSHNPKFKITSWFVIQQTIVCTKTRQILKDSTDLEILTIEQGFEKYKQIKEEKQRTIHKVLKDAFFAEATPIIMEQTEEERELQNLFVEIIQEDNWRKDKHELTDLYMRFSRPDS